MARLQVKLMMSSRKVRVPLRLGFNAREDCGATAVELPVSLIAIVIMGGVAAFGSSVKGLSSSSWRHPRSTEMRGRG